jgi:4'-phosphopantetheinyl transferase EntD
MVTHVISQILPASASVAEVFGDMQTATLTPDEMVLATAAVAKRRHEFTVGRTLARRALAQLGHEPTSILVGPNREPIWPQGIVGSITHCAGYYAAVVARGDRIAALGIDAEPNDQLPDGVLRIIARHEERSWLDSQATGSVCWDRLLFSAKETIFKAWFPLTHCWLDFDAVRVVFDTQTKEFRAELVSKNYALPRYMGFQGKYIEYGDLLLTAAVVPESRQ